MHGTILKDTWPLPWSPSGWLTSTRDFLNSINSQVRLESPWIPVCHWAHDQHIMDDVLCNFLPKQQTAINNVQLFLQVTTLSEISDQHTGRCVLDDFLLPPDSLSDIPLNKSGSTLLWPKHQCPGKQTW